MSNEDKSFLLKYCPGINFEVNITDIGKFDNIIGGYVDYIYGWAADNNLRERCSTGGGITALMCYLLDRDLIDGVIQVGKSENSPFENIVRVSRTSQEVINCAGSRYMPSSPLYDIDEIINSGGKYAFVGRPCDIRALTKYADENSNVKKAIVLKAAFLCGGFPSINATYTMVEKSGIDKNNVKEIVYRGDGWPGYAKVKSYIGEEFKMSYNDSWGKILGPTVPLVCKLCIDSVGEYADIVFGDAWHCDSKGFPDFTEGKGRNMIIVRNSSALEYINNAIESGYLYAEARDVDVKEFRKMQPSQTMRRSLAKHKILASRACLMKLPTANNVHLNRISKVDVISKKHIKSVLGTIKRILRVKMKK